MGLFDSVTNLMSGGAQQGYSDASALTQQGIDSLNSNYASGRAVYDPYAQAGTNALSSLQSYYGGLSNPQDYVSGIMSNWEMSPQAQMNEKYGLKAMNQSAAMGGTVGTPAQQEQLAQYENNLVSGDQQQWFNNVNNTGQQYASGMGNIMNTGFNAANAQGNSYFNQGNALAGLYNYQGTNALGQSMAQGGAINDMIGLGGNAYTSAQKGTLPGADILSLFGFGG